MTEDEKMKFVMKYARLTLKTASIIMVGAFAGILVLTSDKIARFLAAFGVAIEIVSVIVVMLRGIRAMDSVAPPRPKRRKAHLERVVVARFFAMIFAAVTLLVAIVLAVRLHLDGDSIFAHRPALIICGFFLFFGIMAMIHWLLALDVDEDKGHDHG